MKTKGSLVHLSLFSQEGADYSINLFSGHRHPAIRNKSKGSHKNNFTELAPRFRLALFDPKRNDKTLVADKWMKVEDQETLSQVITSIEAKNRYPRLYQILGPNDEFYGYMYLGPSWHFVTVTAKVIDSNSLWISDPKPRILGVP